MRQCDYKQQCLVALLTLLALAQCCPAAAQQGSGARKLLADSLPPGVVAAQGDCPLSSAGFPFFGYGQNQGLCCKTANNTNCAGLVGENGEQLPLPGIPGPNDTAPSPPPSAETTPSPSPALSPAPSGEGAPLPAPAPETAPPLEPSQPPSPQPASPSPAPASSPAAAPAPSPTPSPPACPPLASTEVVAPDATLTWRGDFSQGMEGFAPEYGGNVTALLEDKGIVLGDDPTVPAGSAPEGVAMVTYQANGTGPNSGATFYIYPFGDAPIGDVVRLQYKVMFEKDFDFAGGGSLPGLFQGPVVEDQTKQPCLTVFPKEGDEECFSIRPSWRAGATVELDMYIPKDLQPCTLWAAGAKGLTNPNQPVILGANKKLRLEELKWYTVDLYVKLNTVGQQDGAVLLSFNGLPAVSFPNLVFRSNSSQSIEAIVFASYFVGATPPPDEQHVLFKDFRLLVKQPDAPLLPPPSPAEQQPQQLPASPAA